MLWYEFENGVYFFIQRLAKQGHRLYYKKKKADKKPIAFFVFCEFVDAFLVQFCIYHVIFHKIFKNIIDRKYLFQCRRQTDLKG